MRIRFNVSTLVAQRVLSGNARIWGETEFVGNKVQVEVYHEDDYVEDRLIRVERIKRNLGFAGRDSQTYEIEGILEYDLNRPGQDAGAELASVRIVVKEYHPQSGGVVGFPD